MAILTSSLLGGGGGGSAVPVNGTILIDSTQEVITTDNDEVFLRSGYAETTQGTYPAATWGLVDFEGSDNKYDITNLTDTVNVYGMALVGNSLWVLGDSYGFYEYNKDTFASAGSPTASNLSGTISGMWHDGTNFWVWSSGTTTLLEVDATTKQTTGNTINFASLSPTLVAGVIWVDSEQKFLFYYTKNTFDTEYYVGYVDTSNNFSGIINMHSEQDQLERIEIHQAASYTWSYSNTSLPCSLEIEGEIVQQMQVQQVGTSGVTYLFTSRYSDTLKLTGKIFDIPEVVSTGTSSEFAYPVYDSTTKKLYMLDKNENIRTCNVLVGYGMQREVLHNAGLYKYIRVK